MAKRRVSDKSLRNAEKLSELLLYEASGGNLGTKPAETGVSQTTTFGEKRAFLDSLVKIAALKSKEAPEIEKSGLELLAERLNGNPSDGNKGNNRRTSADSIVDEPESTPGDPPEDGEEDEIV